MVSYNDVTKLTYYSEHNKDKELIDQTSKPVNSATKKQEEEEVTLTNPNSTDTYQAQRID